MMDSNVVSLLPSPEKNLKTTINFEQCIICQTITKEKPQQIKEKSFETITDTANSRRDDVAQRLQLDITSDSVFYDQNPVWHEKCRTSWTSKRNVHARKRKLSPVTSSSSEKRHSTRQHIPEFEYKEMCIICGKARLSGKKKHEKMVTVMTNEVQCSIYKSANDVNDETILRRIQGDGVCSIDMIAYEVRYHRSCYLILRNKVRPVSGEEKYSIYNEAYKKLCADMESLLKNGKLTYLKTLNATYRRYLKETGVLPEVAETYRNQSLKRRLRKTYADSILFWPQDNNKSELICSASLSAGKLISALVDLKQNLEDNYIALPSSDDEVPNDSESDIMNKVMFQAAQKIKADLKNMKCNEKENENDSWNVDYNQACSIVPNSLHNLIAFILYDKPDIADIPIDKDGRVNCDDCLLNNDRSGLLMNERVLNLSQNVVFLKTGVKTPQHVGLAVYVYHKTRSKDLITVLHRLGLCISYTELQRILTSVALDITDKCSEDNIFIPSNIVPGIFTQYAIDNLDFSECTLDGKSMHVTSMVMYQGCELEKVLHGGSMGSIPKRVSSKGSLGESGCLEYLHHVFEIRKLRRDMQPITPVDTEWILHQESGGDTSELNLCWAAARLCPTKLLEVDIDCPGWKVFNAAISQTKSSPTAIGYCPFIQSPPTNPNVVREALQICIKASAKLGLQHTVITQDQAIYEISYTLRKVTPDDYPNLVLRLGGFHLLMNYLGAVGKFMTGSGLRTLLVSSQIMLEGTANKILSGKGYYQAINAHMRVHEGMLSLWWTAFENYCVERDVEDELGTFAELGENITVLNEFLITKDKAQILETLSKMRSCLSKLKTAINEFNRIRSEFKTHAFWMKYVSMIETVLLYIHAEREGVWNEHLAAVSSMIKIIAAADHHKYVKAIVTYLDDMRSLPETAPYVEEQFQHGHFIVKRAGGSFNGIWTDMALECSQNCDAKGKTGQAGLKGATLKAQTEEKWFVTLPFCAAVSSAVKAMLHLDDSEIVHHEDNVATRKREVKNRQAIIETVHEEMINPFTYSESRSLVNIENGLKATEEITCDLLGIELFGENAIRSYVQNNKPCRLNLKTFTDMEKLPKANKKYIKSKNDLTSEIKVLKRALLELNRDATDTDYLEELMKHELRSYPPSICEMDQESHGVYLRTGNKASLLDIMKKRAEMDDWPPEINQSEFETGLVVDVMGMVRASPPLQTEESETYAKRLLENILRKYQCKHIHLAADRYDGLYGIEDSNGGNVNLKESSGCRQRRGGSTKEYEVRKGLVMKNFDDIVRNSDSKANLIEFLFDIWSSSSDMLPDNTHLYLSGGFRNRIEMKVIGSKGEYDAPEDIQKLLTSTHEEADTRIFLHTKAAITSGCEKVIVCASDTDIVVIAMYMFQRLSEDGLHELYIKTKDYAIPIHELVHHFSQTEREMLPLMHALSGCDTNGYMFGKGKRMFMKAVQETGKGTELARLCNDTRSNVTDYLISDTIDTATPVLTYLYTKASFDNLNIVRAHMYYGGTKSLEAIPPTDDAFKQHVLRALFQTHIWVSADNPTPRPLDPFKYGWTTVLGKTKPTLMTNNHVPANLNKDKYCKCKKRCVRNCSCKKFGLQCDIACTCRGHRDTCARVQFDEDNT